MRISCFRLFHIIVNKFDARWSQFLTTGFVQESRLNRASDAKTLRARLEKELCDNANISWEKFSKEPHFTVAHYAGKVNYQIQGMVEKNKVRKEALNGVE